MNNLFSYYEFLLKVKSNQSTVFDETKKIFSKIQKDVLLYKYFVSNEENALINASVSDKRFQSFTNRKLEGLLVLIDNNLNYSNQNQSKILVNLVENGAIIIGYVNFDLFLANIDDSFNLNHYSHLIIGFNASDSLIKISSICDFLRYIPTNTTSNLNRIGILTSCIQDLNLISSLINNDQIESEKILNLISEEIYRKEITIGVLHYHHLQICNSDILINYKMCLERFIKLGINVVEIELEHFDLWIQSYVILNSLEFSENYLNQEILLYEKYKNTNIYNDILKKLILGKLILSNTNYKNYYKNANYIRRIINKNYNDIFSYIDLLFLPTTLKSSFDFEKKVKLNVDNSDYFNVTANFADIPIISFPTGINSIGNKIKMQLQTFRNKDKMLIQFYNTINKEFAL